MKRLFITLLLFLSQGISAQPFDGLSQAVEQGEYGNIKALIISRHGQVIYENYFRGTQADDLHQVQSVTKSIGSALIGIAHRQGKISLNQNMAHFFSPLYDMSQGAFQNTAVITVEQLLKQRHGIEWNEGAVDYRNPLNPVNQMIASDDWYQFVLTRPMDAQPGTRFSYSTGASTLMSRLIRSATGLGPDQFAMQELFEPLGISTVHWEGYSEQGRGFGLTDWPNPDVDVPLGFALWLRARDMVTIGQLYLDGGVFNGRRILDRSWIEASWTKSSHSGNSPFFTEPGWGHGYQWWIARVSDPLGRQWNAFFASGWGSQVIFIIPELGLVMVTTADNYDHNGLDVDALLITRVLPYLNPHLDQRFNGSWYDPETDGQGFSLEVREHNNSVVSYWYTYTQSGEQRWFVLLGHVIEGVGEVTIYATSGGVFLQNDPVALTEWGSGTFTAVDCNRLDFNFVSEETSGTLPLDRLSGKCFDPPE